MSQPNDCDSCTGDAREADNKRLDGANPFGDTLFTDRNWQIVEAFRGVADQLDETPARVALAWVLARPGLDAALMGVSRVEQLHDNIAATDLILPPEQIAVLNTASVPENPMLYGLFSDTVRKNVVFGGSVVSMRM